MKNNTTPTQYANLLKFAQLHDWCNDGRITDHGIAFTDNDGEDQEFSGMQELRNWAGY